MPRLPRSAPFSLAVALLLSAPAASAVTLSLVDEEEPQPGITFRHYQTTDPTTHTWVALVNLCADHVHVDATRAPTSLQTTGSWAAARGVQLATNGDFFRTGPVRVYGDAVGEGIPWPLAQTGTDPSYSFEWYYQDYGWIAFLWDGIEFTHTKWVKDNAASLGATGGWQPDEVAPAPPPGTLALVSGFPELVVEGTQITCSSPTDPSCFPDRSDMRQRHPRTAMGFTEDRGTFILAVVDGRSAISVGMYGAELADLMFQLGAWEAFNLDGGGSSTMWVDGSVRNDPSDGSQRSVANHWGVFAGIAGGKALRPGHCAESEPCGVIPPEGGIVDDDSPCFQTYGDPQYWREEAAGHGGRLFWTNAWQTSQPGNWAWWRLDFAQGGEYLVEFYAESGFAVFDQTHYVVQAGTEATTLAIDQSAGTGWQELGTFVFDEGGAQFVAVYDDFDAAVPADQHVVADAVRLTRLGTWCGDGSCDDDEDCTSCLDDCAGPVEIPDNDIDDDCDGTVDEPPGAGGGGVGGAGVGGAGAPGLGVDGDEESGCSCSTPSRGSPTPALLLALIGLVVARARRARRRLSPGK
ncbi:MAG: phosphodiester glycosidase family protein [Deltaproteobacteria bacterium]|jgi:MYXO-CTERM domain-containing protein|nr:phosphodiester glycosidase family protein [Deltaproteobacteria bacterium]MBW2532340.1 phosphodiester glycosidase family protein [Deltaproteobacteria bacterium]